MSDWKPKGLQLVQLAEKSFRSTTTVARTYEGRGNAFSRSAVAEAAKALRLPPPPDPASSSRR